MKKVIICSELYHVKKNFHRMRIDKLTSILFSDLSRSEIKNQITLGNILLNKNTCSPHKIVKENDEIQFNIKIDNKNIDTIPNENIVFDIVYEDSDLFIINKPKNQVVHPGAGNTRDTIVNGLAHKRLNQKVLPRYGLIHRLDKDTTGLLIIAKTLNCYLKLAKMLQDREIKRFYKALIIGSLANSIKVKSYITRNKNNRTKMQVSSTGKEAISEFYPIETYSKWSLIKCKLETGRTHQIRVHLNSKLMSIIGDPTYKQHNSKYYKDISQLSRQALHAYKLEFEHPINKKFLSIEIDLPDDFKNAYKNLKNNV